ncbi:Putative NAD(P)H nitroreductase [Sphingomonas antarctica]|uniref:nitroreductase family protein n=1 Tax=Sphingomonas antarctica TaxID=2040274 RepID=UPI0039EB5D61
MLNDLSSPLSLLTTRRSGKPRDMVAPGPDSAQLDTILTIAARTPDHKKLVPWRFVIIDDREKFATLLADAFRAERAAAEGVDLGKLTAFAHDAPMLIAVMSAPDALSRVPLWEQELSAGAACMNLLHAAHALGFVAAWITGWAAFSPIVAAGIGEAGERIAGFLFIGTTGAPLEDRPRPPIELVVRHWG